MIDPFRASRLPVGVRLPSASSPPASTGTELAVEKPGQFELNLVDIPGSVAKDIESATELYRYTLGVPIAAATETGPGQVAAEVFDVITKPVRDIVGTVAGAIGAGLTMGLDALGFLANNAQAFIIERNLEAYRRSPEGRPFFDPLIISIPFTKAKDLVPDDIAAQLKAHPETNLTELAWKQLRSGYPFGEARDVTGLLRNIVGTVLIDPLLFIPYGTFAKAARAVTVATGIPSVVRMAANTVTRLPLLDAATSAAAVVDGYVRAVGSRRLSKFYKIVAGGDELAERAMAEAGGAMSAFLHETKLTQDIANQISAKAPRITPEAERRVEAILGSDIVQQDLHRAVAASPRLVAESWDSLEEALGALRSTMARVYGMRVSNERYVERMTRDLQTYVVPRLVASDVARFAQTPTRAAIRVPGALDDDEVAWAAYALSKITNRPIEEMVPRAQRLLSGADRGDMLSLIHNHLYGRALIDLGKTMENVEFSWALKGGEVRTISAHTVNLVSDRTLTVERAKALRAQIRELLPELRRSGQDPDVLRRASDLYTRGLFYEDIFRTLPAHITPTDAEEYRRILKEIDVIVGGLIKADRLPRILTREYVAKLRVAKETKEGLMRLVDDWEQRWGNSYNIGFNRPEPVTISSVTEDNGVTQYIASVWLPISFITPNPLKPSVSREIVESLLRVPQFRVAYDYQTRLANILERTFGVEYRARAKALFYDLSRRARQADVAGPTGLSYRDARDAFGTFLTRDEVEKLEQTFGGDIRRVILEAWIGSVGNAGLLPALSSRLIRRLGIWSAMIARRIYPQYRFLYDPGFQLQELAEAKFWPLLEGRLTKEQVPKDVFLLSQRALQSMDLDIMFEAYMGSWVATGETLRRTLGIPVIDIKLMKDREMYKDLAYRAANDWEKMLRDVLDEITPGVYREYMAIPAKDQVERFVKFLEERLSLWDPARLGETMKKAAQQMSRSALYAPTPETTTVWSALEYVLEKAAQRAFETQYFAADRGWLLRALNHPALGLYPLSYYWKVAKRFGEAMFWGPFGLRRPLYGLEAYKRLHEVLVTEILGDPEGTAARIQNEYGDTLFTLQMLLPGTPESMPFNAPPWMRHVAQAVRGDFGEITFGQFVGEEVTRTASSFGILRTIRMAALSAEEMAALVGQSVASIPTYLDAASSAYDMSNEAAARVRQIYER